ncbi:hypothetical protein PRN20_13960 [Devosia sp. ZB163]|uniref:hypothetical protein n=1 Tax=Devosia sp. ZB163 TaxID=3025938 RepID=UPI00235F52DB|nr:hypothetical protein [Devosia sp. ZB163]MDC9824836.1 hypothetical protein [Devosia sp. ZB163]
MLFTEESVIAMRLPEWTWHWAWAAFLRWSLNPTLASNLTARQRWQVVLWSLGPGTKRHYLSPLTEWLHRHLPTAILLARLQRQGAGWYRVPTMPAAIHLWRRLGVHVLEGDFVRIESGSVTMKGYVDEDRQVCEFWPIEE